MTNPLLPIKDLVIIDNYEPIITVKIGDNRTVIIGNNELAFRRENNQDLHTSSGILGPNQCT